MNNDEQPVVWKTLRAILPTITMCVLLVYAAFMCIQNAHDNILVLSGGSLYITVASYLLATDMIPKLSELFPNDNFIWQSRISWALFSVSLLLTLGCLVASFVVA